VDPLRQGLSLIVCVWKIEDSLFEGWGEEHWQPEDLSATSKLNAGGR
jgi:coronin-1B/1C/6